MDDTNERPKISVTVRSILGFIKDLNEDEVLALGEMIEHGRLKDNIHDWMEAKEVQNGN